MLAVLDLAPVLVLKLRPLLVLLDGLAPAAA